VEASPGIDVMLPIPRVEVESLGDAHAALFLTMRQESFHGDSPLKVRVVRDGSDGRDVTVLPLMFLGAAR
jgi:hypothetical protein